MEPSWACLRSAKGMDVSPCAFPLSTSMWWNPSHALLASSMYSARNELAPSAPKSSMNSKFCFAFRTAGMGERLVEDICPGELTFARISLYPWQRTVNMKS